MSNNRILTELPRYIEGRYKGKVNCKAMVGMKLELEYKQNIYIVEIIDYIKGNPARFKIEYNGEIREIAYNNFMSGKFGGILNKWTKSFKYSIGDEIKEDEGRDIVIIDREYRERNANGKSVINDKWYKYRCNKCGWDEGWIVEGDLLKGNNCSCCASKVVVEDINSIWATDRWMCDLGLSEEDAKIHTRSSNDKVFVTCPECGKQKEMKVATLYNYGLGCICGDGVKYPEKFMISVLDQLNIEYIFQLTKTTFDWCEDKRYDFYIPLLNNTIIETHGRQHYEDCTWSKAKDVQENDRIKHELALQNGIKDEDYIVIDCRYSDKEWIKNNILSSKLNKLFDLEKRINWNKCEEFALCNLVKSVCDYWNNDKKDWETTADLEKIFKVDKDTIRNYLNKGKELGWCNYNGKEEIKKVGRRNGERCGKTVGMYDLEGNFIMKESSVAKLKERCLKELNVDLSTGAISAVCNGKRKTHKGYIFKYID